MNPINRSIQYANEVVHETDGDAVNTNTTISMD